MTQSCNPTTPVRERPLHLIAREIIACMLDEELGRKVHKPLHERYWAAWPYLQALLTMNSIDEPYYADTGVSVVLYGVSNLQTWRGENAKRLKAELLAMAKRRTER